MKIFDILQESKTNLVEQHLRSSELLLESVCQDLNRQQKQIVEGIYNELRPLIEASLTADQINKIFTDVEAGATAGGGNRTMLGKAADVPGKVNDIINNVGKWLQDTTPVKMADQKFDQLKAKVGAKFPELDKQLTGLGTWMKDNPGKSAAIIGVMTALASLAGGPVGGAIAGQVLRGAAELVKGEKLSTAVGKGVKTAAFGFIAGKAFEMLGDYLGGLRADIVMKGEYADASWDAAKTIRSPGFEWTQQIKGVNIKVLPDDAETIKFLSDTIGKGGSEAVQAFDKLARLAAEIRSPEYKQLLADVGAMARDNDSLYNWIQGAKEGLQAASQGAVAATTGSKGKKESKDLSRHQLQTIFEWCNGSTATLNEGPLDWIKQKGKNLTTKITADKLQKAWKAAGSPTDSDQVADILRSAGVSDEVLSPVYKSMKVKLNPQGAAKPQQQSTGDKSQNTKQQATTNIDLKSILTAVNTMRSRDLQSLNKYADQLLGKSTAAKPPAPSAKGAVKSKTGNPNDLGFGFNQDTGTPFKSQAERDAFYKQDGSVDPRKRAAPATPPAQPNTVKVANKTRGKPAAKPAVAV
jgi:hypothetical protein